MSVLRFCSFFSKSAGTRSRFVASSDRGLGSSLQAWGFLAPVRPKFQLPLRRYNSKSAPEFSTPPNRSSSNGDQEELLKNMNFLEREKLEQLFDDSVEMDDEELERRGTSSPYPQFPISY
jgi:hypothetical protein